MPRPAETQSFDSSFSFGGDGRDTSACHLQRLVAPPATESSLEVACEGDSHGDVATEQLTDQAILCQQAAAEFPSNRRIVAELVDT